MKIPDAIICATAIAHNALLLTNDRQLLNIAEVQSIPLLLTPPVGQT
jgi:predicted nucleic acid-binding protein